MLGTMWVAVSYRKRSRSRGSVLWLENTVSLAGFCLDASSCSTSTNSSYYRETRLSTGHFLIRHLRIVYNCKAYQRCRGSRIKSSIKTNQLDRAKPCNSGPWSAADAHDASHVTRSHVISPCFSNEASGARNRVANIHVTAALCNTTIMRNPA